jgi:molybdate transport system permease protein
MYELTTTLLVTLKVATSAVALAAAPALSLGFLLARRQFFGKSLVEALTTLPLVLPPTAVGYLLLELLSFDGPFGAGRLGFDLGLLLTWKGATLASSVMASPLIVRTARVAFETVDPRYEQLARTLGLGAIDTLVRVTLPLASRGLLAALVLGFARALGEFGATIVVAGSIPGETRTLAVAIYSFAETGQDAQALRLVLVSVAIAFVALWSANWLAERRAAS